MASSGVVQDVSPIRRSREENQERAFIAASRRKDRSLAARLESAGRASLLHNKRTGKAFHITKEIVEKEAMYEEIDEGYQEKCIRMLQAQHLETKDKLYSHLLATTHWSRSISFLRHDQRARMSPCATMDNTVHRVNPNLPDPGPASHPDVKSGPLMSSMETIGDNVALCVKGKPHRNTQSPHMTCMHGSCISNNLSTLSDYAPLVGAADSIPTNVLEQTPPKATLSTQFSSSCHTTTETPEVVIWQKKMVQQVQITANAVTTLQRTQSGDKHLTAPELPHYHSGSSPPSTMSSRSDDGHPPSQQPSIIFRHQQIHLNHASHVTAQILSHSGAREAAVGTLSVEHRSPSDFSPSPSTSTATKQAAAAMLSYAALDAEFGEFYQFALDLPGLTQSRLQG